MPEPRAAPLISVIVLNYNGSLWIERCLASLDTQSIRERLEVIVADNKSSDGSDLLAERILGASLNGKFVQHGQNLGYCEGNNRAVSWAVGEFLLFLNNDTWLEPDCLEILVRETQAQNAHAASPLVLDYDDNCFQSLGAGGFDIFGLSSSRLPFQQTRELFMPEGCAYLIRRNVFEKLGGFDSKFFMFSDELDLSWRLWICGFKAIGVPCARLHHRGAANVNPKGDGRMVELRTSDTKRYYANRNGLLVLLKNAQGILYLLVLFQLLLYFTEALASLVIVRRWSFISNAYWKAVIDCFSLRKHVSAQRQRIKTMRRRSDWWMLRFFRLRLNRWDEVLRIVRLGRFEVTPR